MIQCLTNQAQGQYYYLSEHTVKGPYRAFFKHYKETGLKKHCWKIKQSIKQFCFEVSLKKT
jgi:hypothetical protein